MQFLHEDLVRDVVVQITPLSDNQRIIPFAYDNILYFYPDLDKTDLSILFVGVVYKIFSPAAFIEGGLVRAPTGIRQKICDIMQWADPPVCNYYMSMAKVYITRPFFKERVDLIIESLGIISNTQMNKLKDTY